MEYFILFIAIVYFTYEIRTIKEYITKKRNNHSYKLGLTILPNWIEIIKKISNDENLSFEKVLNDIKNIKKDLYRKNFTFTIFYNSLSGIEQIWSKYNTDFVNDLEIIGTLFSSDLDDSYPDSNLNNFITINPSYIGFPNVLPDNSLLEEEKIGEIPFDEIIDFFIKLDRNLSDSSMYQIKKFPKELEDQFKKYNIEYDSSASDDRRGLQDEPKKDLFDFKYLKENGIEIYKQRIRYHTFKNPYYSISFDIEFFNN
ncbi:hypothetical protein EOM09_01605 [bacterium]|nr:hypothetical protein [bacterium]